MKDLKDLEKYLLELKEIFFVHILNKSFTDHNDYLKLKKRLYTCEKKYKDGKQTL